jgi:hypothetical protein
VSGFGYRAEAVAVGGVCVGAVGGVQSPAGLVPRRVVPAVIFRLALLQIGVWGGRALHHVFRPRAAVELGTVARVVGAEPSHLLRPVHLPIRVVVVRHDALMEVLSLGAHTLALPPPPLLTLGGVQLVAVPRVRTVLRGNPRTLVMMVRTVARLAQERPGFAFGFRV